MNRTHNSLRNAFSGLGGQLLTGLLRFLCRTVFIRTLGQEYLGISGLYANILTVLSISELGFSTAVTYSLYVPLAKGDRAAVRAIMAFLRRAYRVVGLGILALGLALVPVLPRLMNGVTDKVNIYQYYLLYLAETVVSYLFCAYKATLLIADQRKYAVDVATCCVQLLTGLVQVAVLLLWKSFFGYTLLSIACSLAVNLTVGAVTDRRYPWLREKSEPLPRQEKRAIFDRVFAAALYRISTALGSAKDNLLVSAFVNVATVGLYSNYSLIIGLFQRFLSGIFQSFSASLGNLYATNDRHYNEFIFRCLNLVNHVLVAVAAVGFYTVFQPFITLWAGESYLLPAGTLAVIVANFVTNYWQTVPQLYCNASGVFVRGKFRAAAGTAANLALSLVLVQRMGLPGVLLGSICSRLLVGWWFDPWLVYRRGFSQSPASYFLSCGLNAGVILGCCWGITRLCALLPLRGWLQVLLPGALSTVLPTAVYALLYCRSRELTFLLGKAREALRRR